jgi:uncharacterized protein YndB with AHSA1/START domain
MSETETDTKTKDLVFEYELDAPPEKVWRAISIPAFRDKWLPQEALVGAEPVSSVPGKEVRYGMREDEAPFLESVVTFQVEPNGEGRTRLRTATGRASCAPPDASPQRRKILEEKGGRRCAT